MKGLVFTTFYEFCEANYGGDILDDVIQAADLPNDGAYTSVGTYSFSEMISLVTALSKISGKPLDATLEKFGVHCFSTWVKNWPSHFDGKDLFDILASVDEFHEREVRKIYPDAELPSFRVVSRTEDRLVLGYRSCKPLADLAGGVIKGVAVHLNESVRLRHEPAQDAEDEYVRITINRRG